MHTSRGGSLLLPDQLSQGQAGPGQPKVHCVCKGTAPSEETSFQAWAGPRVMGGSEPRDRLPPTQTSTGAEEEEVAPGLLSS